MKKEKTVEITVETEEILILNRRTLRVRPARCEGCGAEVELVSPDLAAFLTEMSELAVYGLIEAGRVHFTETPERTLLVCLNSLISLQPVCGVVATRE